MSDFGIEERTLVDIGASARVARDEGLIPSISGRRTAKGSTPPPNVIPFTKPRAMAAVAAANPSSIIIEASATNALKNFDNTVLPAKQQAERDEKTTPFTMDSLGQGNNALPPAATRVATGWTPPGAVPTTPVAKLPAGAQTLYAVPPQNPMPGSVIGQQGHTVIPVPAVHSAQTSAPKLALPPLQAPPVTHVARTAQAWPVAAPAAQPSHTAPASMPVAAWPASPPVTQPKPVAPPPPVAPQPVATLQPYQAGVFPAAPAPPAPVACTYPAASDLPIGDFMAMPEPAKKSRWEAFERLGLGMPKKLLGSPQKLIVNAYRLLGFVILTIIVVVLVGYIANTAFFYMSDSWVVPMAVSPTDEKVVTLQAALAEQQNTRDKIAGELAQADRSIQMQQNFQLAFAKAIKSDLDGRKAALGRMRALANNAASTRSAIKSQNYAYANANRKRMKQEYDAGLIDRNAMMSGNFQLAQISNSNLSLAERQADFETKAQLLEAETRSLDAILSNIDDKDTALSYEVLRIKQEYAASRLDLQKSIDMRDTLKGSLARQDKIVESLKKSSYLRAIADSAQVAFVPYGNLGKATKGSSVYACKVGMVFCSHVGEILEVLPGEVQFKHPQRDRMLRGQMIEMKLDADSSDAAAGDVLYVGGKPLFI